jgi:hypothetical protein
MAGRYLRTFCCEDCAEWTRRMWQGGKPLICIECAKVRVDVAATAAHEASIEHRRARRLEVLARRAAEAQQVALLRELLSGPGGELAGKVADSRPR